MICFHKFCLYCVTDSDHAAECLDHLQTMLWDGGDHSQDDNVSSLICMLQSPLFRQLLILQDSMQELEEVRKHTFTKKCMKIIKISTHPSH